MNAPIRQHWFELETIDGDPTEPCTDLFLSESQAIEVASMLAQEQGCSYRVVEVEVVTTVKTVGEYHPTN